MRLPRFTPNRIRAALIASGALLGLLASTIGEPGLPPLWMAVQAALVGAVAGLLAALIGRPTPRALAGGACGLAVITCILSGATPDYSPSPLEYLPSCILFPLVGALLARTSLRGAIIGAGLGTVVAFAILAKRTAAYCRTDPGAAASDIPAALLLALMVGVPGGAVLGGIVDRLGILRRLLR